MQFRLPSHLTIRYDTKIHDKVIEGVVPFFSRDLLECHVAKGWCTRITRSRIFIIVFSEIPETRRKNFQGTIRLLCDISIFFVLDVATIVCEKSEVFQQIVDCEYVWFFMCLLNLLLRFTFLFFSV